MTLTLVVCKVLFVIVRGERGSHRPDVASFDRLACVGTFRVNLFRTLSVVPNASHSNSSVLKDVMLNASHFVTARFSFFVDVPVVFKVDFLGVVGFNFGFAKLRFTILLSNVLATFLISVITVGFLVNCLGHGSFGTFN